MLSEPEKPIEPPKEPRPVTWCDYCGAPIYPGDDYYRPPLYLTSYRDVFCVDCVEGWKQTAEENPPEE